MRVLSGGLSLARALRVEGIDGGVLFISQELATPVQQQVNVVANVFNDNAYGALKLYQDRVQVGCRGGVTVIECPLAGDLLSVPPPWL